MKCRSRIVAAAIWLISLPLLAQSGLDPEQADRYHELNAELRCLVCQNQTIAESNAPLAKDLRDQVEKQILAGRSNEQILGYMTDRYGDFVRYRPPWNARTLMLWVGPFVLVLLGLLFIWRSMIRRRPADTADQALGTADPESVRRILDEVTKR